MRWTPGDRGNIDDARGRSGGGLAGLGIGGFLILLVLSWVSGTNLFSLLGTDSSSPTGSVGTSGELRTSPAEERMVDFVDAVYLWIENEERVAGTQNGARARLGNLDAHFLIAADIDVARFYRGILHHRCVFDVFDIGTECVEVLRGLVHHSQDALDGPVCARLGGARVERTRRTAENHKREEEK